MSIAIIAAIAAIVVVVLLMVWVISAASGIVGFVLHLVMAGVIGVLADRAVPGRLPYGWIGAVVAGLLGSWLGVRLIGSVGPSLFGVPLLPAFVGALILAVAVSLFTHFSRGRGRHAF